MTDSQTIETRADEIEEAIAAALGDEERLLAEIAQSEKEADALASKAYLDGKKIQPTPTLDAARTRLRACRTARIHLLQERDALSASLVSAKVDELTATATALKNHRDNVVALASAMTVITARLWAFAVGDPGGSYEMNGRIGNCGIFQPGDVPGYRYAELRRIAAELRAHGFEEATDFCAPRPQDIPGGQQLTGKPIVATVRQLVARIEGDLRAAEIFPKELPLFNVDSSTQHKEK